MSDALVSGLKGRADTVVTAENTAAAAGSGGLPVFATPFMVSLMEKAASESVQPFLDGDHTTVGVSLSITHDAPTPVGMAVYAESELTAVEGKRLTFAVTAFDEAGPIGSGTHERAIITTSRFMERVNGKLK